MFEALWEQIESATVMFDPYYALEAEGEVAEALAERDATYGYVQSSWD